MRPQSFRSTFFIVFAIIGTLISVQTQASTVPRAPQIDARGYLLMDATSGQIIVEHNAEQRLPPASLTKMMTAYIAEAELQKGAEKARAISKPLLEQVREAVGIFKLA